MCYQTRQIRTVKDLELRFSVGLVNEDYRPVFDKPAYHLNGFAHPNMLVIPQDKSDALAPGVWGIVPDNKQPDEVKDYYKESVRYGSGLNAQSEKLFNHFIYRNVALTQRCLIPVSGFFEPHHHLKKSYPYYIHRQDDDTMAMAGIYTVIGTYLTFAILTREASPILAEIHNKRKREPVLLPQSVEKDWLLPDLSQNDVMELVNTPYNYDSLETYTVSKDVHNARVDSNRPDIVDRVDYPELQKLF
ncbi:MAG: SOS response-associated peptidase [Flavobacteriaceae bacterium]|nr:SOS response-associated peptidase [Flavobacteriaceae bacterium]NNK29553.1 SOS response-associated peptidase [Flavobacteriaceae bacterium]NNK87716.1 SOS response-associated peptidase [Flavobacteriaceae bacterium]